MEPETVLDYWFGKTGEPRLKLWFGGDAATDADIRARFGKVVEAAGDGALDSWTATPRGRLALLILLDQFTRNIHRNSPRAFAYDERAQGIALEGLARRDDRALPVAQRAFFYLPLEHAEDRALQARSVAECEAMAADAQPEHQQWADICLDYARRHQAVIERFGRFPHRNALLGRASTPEETEFLASGKGPF